MSWHTYTTRQACSFSAEPLTMGVLQKKCSCGGSGNCEECDAKGMQRSATGRAPENVPHSVHETLRSPGQGLDQRTRGFMETHFGHDFGHVRVHTDARATQSASAVHAAAYTVGEHIVFGSGQYSPATEWGRSLLAHELTHVVQQGSASPASLERMRHGETASRAEAEAEAAAAQVSGPGDAPRVTITSTGPGLDSQSAGAGGGQQQPPQLTPFQQAVEDARRAAFIRCQLARDITAGVGPPGPIHPDGKPAIDPNLEGQFRAKHLASLMFEWPDPNMEQIAQILGTMMTRLSPGISAMTAPTGEKFCNVHAAYVIDHKPPIYLCPSFAPQSPEEKIRTLIHESAHLAGIGQPAGEGYCAVMDCSGPCPGGFDSADSWAQYVCCLTGHGDKAVAIQAKKTP